MHRTLSTRGYRKNINMTINFYLYYERIHFTEMYAFFCLPFHQLHHHHHRRFCCTPVRVVNHWILWCTYECALCAYALMCYYINTNGTDETNEAQIHVHDVWMRRRRLEFILTKPLKRSQQLNIIRWQLYTNTTLYAYNLYILFVNCDLLQFIRFGVSEMYPLSSSLCICVRVRLFSIVMDNWTEITWKIDLELSNCIVWIHFHCSCGVCLFFLLITNYHFISNGLLSFYRIRIASNYSCPNCKINIHWINEMDLVTVDD